MDDLATIAQCTDAAEYQSALAVEAEGTQYLLGIPAAFAARQNGFPEIVAERPGREIEIGKMHLLLADRGPWTFGIGIGRGHDPVGLNRAFGSVYQPFPVALFPLRPG